MAISWDNKATYVNSTLPIRLQHLRSERRTWLAEDFNRDSSHTVVLTGDTAEALFMDANYKAKMCYHEMAKRDRIQALTYNKGGQRIFAGKKASHNAGVICSYLADNSYSDGGSYCVADIIEQVGSYIVLAKGANTRRLAGRSVDAAVRQEILTVLRQMAIQAAVFARNTMFKLDSIKTARPCIEIHYGYMDDVKGIVFRDLKPIREFAPESKNHNRGTNEPWIIFVNDPGMLRKRGARYTKASDSHLDTLVSQLTR